MAARKYSHEFKGLVCAAYVAGATPRGISAQYGIPRSTVGTIVTRNGVQRPRSGNLKQQILKAFRPARGTSDIAREVKCTRAYVYIVLNQCGLYHKAAR